MLFIPLHPGFCDLCFRTNVLDGQILWRDIPDLWHWGHQLCRERPRGSYRPHGLHLSPNDKMHFPQVWKIWGDRATWRYVYPTPEHHQWKDLHISLVLDDNSYAADPISPSLQVLNCVLPPNASILDVSQVSHIEKRSDQYNHQEKSSWRLVANLLTWPECRLPHI